MKQEFRFENLREIGLSAIPAMLNDEIRKAVVDIGERQHDAKERRVELLLTLKPKMDQQRGIVDAVELSVKCQSKLPCQRTEGHQLSLDPRGTLYYNDLDGGAVRQRTLDEIAVHRETGEEIK